MSLVTWNSEAFILGCLKSLQQQTLKDFQVIIVDNASQDDTVAHVRSEYPHVKILRHPSNLGFSRAHNLVIGLSKTPYVLVLNPDVILAPDFLEKAVAAMEHEPKAGSVQGKILQFAFAAHDDLRQPVRSHILDSTGLIGTQARAFKNRGEGMEDTGLFDSHNDIFGPTGACALYRKDALASVQYHQEFFDEDFFAYVEDSDLAWRLRWKGWTSRYVPDAMAWHYRNIRTAEKTRALLQNRQTRSLAIRRRAAANAIAVLVKNLDTKTFWRHSLRIIGYELAKAGYLVLREPRVLPAYGHLMRLLPKMLKKRKIIQRQRTVARTDIEPYFS